MRNVFLVLTVLLISICSLRAQSPLIPYRIGDKWGFSDTAMNIIVEPIYDSVSSYNNYPKGYYTVAKNGKWGVITKDKVIIEPILNNVGFEEFDSDIVFFDSKTGIVDENKQIFIRDSYNESEIRSDGNRYLIQEKGIYYNLKGERLFQDTVLFMEMYDDFINLYLVRFSNLKYSMFYYDKVKNKVSYWVFKDADYIDYNGESFVIRVGNEKSFYHLKKNSSTKKMELFFLKKVLLEDEIVSRALSEVAIDSRIRVVRKGRFWKEEISFNGSQYYFITKVGTKTKILRKDTIFKGELKNKEFEVKSYSLFMEYSSDRTIDHANRIEYLSRKKYLKYNEGGKFGVVTSKRVLPELYEEIYGFIFSEIGDILFMVKQEGKFGVIQDTGSWVIPPLYDTIMPIEKRGSFVVEKAGKQGLVSLSIWGRTSNLLEVEYDSIFSLDWTAYGIVKSGNYGYFGDISLKPVFKNKVIGFRSFNGFQVWELVDESGKFLGYAKPNGELFFKED